jgi:ABC-type protease/lipase transport system fused ATPase/permease subunit
VVIVVAVLLLVVVGLVAVFAYCTTGDPVSEEARYRAAVELHATRRRLEVAQVRGAMRRDAARVWRELAHELREMDEAGGRG